MIKISSVFQMPSPFIRHLVVVVLYVLMTVTMTWPAAVKLHTSVIGGGGDPWQSLWRFEQKSWELTGAVAQGQLGPYVRHELLGGGQSRLVNVSVWPWMPLHWIFGQPLAYNLVWLLSFILSGLAMYALLTYLISTTAPETYTTNAIWHLGPILGGIFYMFLPFHVAHSFGHFGAMQLQWLPLIILLLFLCLRRLSWSVTLTLAVATIIQFWTEHHYVLWLAVFLVIFLLWYRREVRLTLQRRGAWLHVVIALALIVFFGALPSLPTGRLALAEQTPLELGRDQLLRFSADLVSFLVPAPFHTLWGASTNDLFSSFFRANVAEATQYLGLVPLLLIIFFHQQVPLAQRKFWAAIVIVFLVVSLGPQLHIMGQITPIRLPYELVDELPVLRSVRTVSRAGVMVGLAAAVLFGWVVASQVRRPANAVLVTSLVLAEFLFLPVPTQTAQLSPAYAFLQQQTGSRVIEIPTATNYIIASRALFASLAHGKEVLGNIALERAEGRGGQQMVQSVPAVRQLLYLRTTELLQGRTEFFDQDLVETLPDALRWLDVAAVIVHADSLSGGQLGAVTMFLEEAGLVRQKFDDVDVYTADQPGTATDGMFVLRGEGWSNVGFDRKRSSVFAEIEDEASITVINIRSDPADVVIHFQQPIETAVGGEISYNNVIVAKYQPGENNVSVDLTLAPGANELIWRAGAGGKSIIQNPSLVPRKD